MRASRPLAYSLPPTRRAQGLLHAVVARIRHERSPRATARTGQWRLEAACWLAAIVIGASQQWASVDVPSSMDLVSYLDIGDAWVRGHWKEAINGYWNPLYSWLLGVVVAVVRPSARFEYPVVEAVDFAIFLVTLLGFAWFLRAVRRASRTAAQRAGEGRPAIPDWAWVLGGYTLFAWAAVRWISLSSNTPDMLATALLFAAWGIVLRLDEREALSSYAALGLVLGLAYLSRTPMLIVGAALLGAMAWEAKTPARRRGAGLAAAVMLAVALPLVVTVSLARGHLTVGDNGRLNHAWLANPRPHIMPNRYWQGGPPGSGTPAHPVRMLWQEPAAYEFAGPIDGTYPPWTDPSYWYEGLTYHFDAEAEWATLRNNVRFYWVVFGRWLLPALLLALLVAGDARRTLRVLLRSTPSWLPPVVGLGLYLLAADLPDQKMKLQPPHRYVAAFVVLLTFGLALSIRFRRAWWPASSRRAAAVIVVGVSVALFARMGVLAWRDLRAPDPAPPWRIAQALEDAGIAPGMRIATVGQPDYHEYWARLARVRIVADVPDDRAFWSVAPDVRDAILDRLAGVGVQAVVCWWVPPGDVSAAWQRTAGTTYAVRRLNRP